MLGSVMYVTYGPRLNIAPFWQETAPHSEAWHDAMLAAMAANWSHVLALMGSEVEVSFVGSKAVPAEMVRLLMADAKLLPWGAP